MRNPISSVQYWVNTGKPPCLSVVDENYNSPEETSLSEAEISAFHPAAVSPFEHNSPHPPQPAIIPSEPTKLSSSIVSSDSVNTRDYILSSNLAKKNMKLTDIAVSNNNIEEVDVYVDVCGTDELPKTIHHNKEEKSINSQSTVIYGSNNDVLKNSQSTTLLLVPTGSLKIEDVIPSLRQIRDSPEIYECVASSDKSTSQELQDLFVTKTINEQTIIDKNHRRKLFTNPSSPVEFSEFSNPKQISRKSSSLSNNSVLHPAFDYSDPKKQLQIWRKKSFYKNSLLSNKEKNKTIPSEKFSFNEEKLKKCSVILNPLRLSNVQKKRKSVCENGDDTPDTLECKKIKFSKESKSTKKMTIKSDISDTKKNSQLMKENQLQQSEMFDSKLASLSEHPKLKHCSIILIPLNRFSIEKGISDQPEDKKTRSLDKFVSNENEKEQDKMNSERKKNATSIRNSVRISTQNISKFTEKKRDIRTSKLEKDFKKLQKVSDSSELKHLSNPSICKMEKTFSFGRSDSDDTEESKNENISTKYNGDAKGNRKLFTSIFSIESDEESDMTSIFHKSRNIVGLKEVNKENKIRNLKHFNENVLENNPLLMELSHYTSEENENSRNSILNIQLHGSNSRRWTRLIVVPSSSEDELSQKEKIPRRKRKNRENSKQPKMGENSTKEESSSLKVPVDDEQFKLNTQFDENSIQVSKEPCLHALDNEESKFKDVFHLSSKKNKQEIDEKEKDILSNDKHLTNTKTKISKLTKKEMKSSLKVPVIDEQFKLNTQFHKNTEMAGKSCLHTLNIKESEFENIFEFLEKKKQVDIDEKEKYNVCFNLKEENIKQSLKKENAKQMRKQINCKQTRKEENLKQQKFITDKEESKYIVRHKSMKDDKHFFKNLDFSSSDEETSKNTKIKESFNDLKLNSNRNDKDIFDLITKKSHTKIERKEKEKKILKQEKNKILESFHDSELVSDSDEEDIFDFRQKKK
ncbi:uncharacterized protein LOC127290410 isoform X2 [Leptopilina boulardi]|nr:uncharacterized protein LOC127290410 isoform X2 [Leptopilina boulardi]